MSKSGFHKRKSRDHKLEEIQLRDTHDSLGYQTISKDTMEESLMESVVFESPTSPTYHDEHIEPHFESSEIVRDIVIGLSDGLTVPFALAAGLATLDNSRLVVTAGMAEIAAGAISMGLGGYLAGHLEIEHYDAERAREQYEVDTVPEKEEEEIVEIFEPYGLSKRDLEPMLVVLKKDPEKWVDFMMKFELSLERPSKWRTWISALTIGTSYFLGGLIPLIPYMVLTSVKSALYFSLLFTLGALFIFGYVKGRLIGSPNPLFSAFSMMMVGGMAAGSAYFIAASRVKVSMGSPESSKMEDGSKQLKASPSVATDDTQIVVINNSRDSISSASSSHGHKEPHFGSAEVVRDIVIGLSDGLTVPFALAAGLATLDNSRLVVTAGMAEVVAGAISMGLGGYLAGLSEIEHYDAERAREQHEVETIPEREEEEIVEIFEPYGLSKKDLEPLLNVLRNDKEAWIDFMMKFELQLERPSVFRSWISALTIGLAYFLGGLIPLFPYMIFSEAMKALELSAGVTLISLYIFGYVKAKILGTPRPLLSAIQMMLVGGAAAGCAFGIAKAIPQPTI